MNPIRIQVIPQHSSQQEDDDLAFIVQKTNKNLRKLSDMYIEDDSTNNFCFKHDAQNFTAMRVYINSLNNPQIRLYYSKFTPKRKIGAICIIHGYGQSSDDYIQTATYFAKQGFVVNMIDLRGFGYSGGFRVNNSIKSTLSDISNLLTRCCQNGLPTYLLCHGYGCLLAFSLLQQNPNLPLSGVIALSPLFSFPNVNQNSIIHQMALMMSPSIFDDILINNNINPTGLTNNPKKIKKIVDGVFNYQYVTLKMFKQFNQLSQKVRRDSVKFNYPLLVCVGTNDFIQNPKQAQNFIQKVSTSQRQIIYFQNGYHQLYNDVNNEQLFHNIQAWIMTAESKKNQVLWNSGKCGTFKLDVSPDKSYRKKVILYLVGILLGIIALIKKLRKCVSKCSSI